MEKFVKIIDYFIQYEIKNRFNEIELKKGQGIYISKGSFCDVDNIQKIVSDTKVDKIKFLVKKIKFRTSLLPIVKVISSTCIHLFYMLFTIFIYIIYGYSIEWAWLNIIYYSFCLFVLSIGVSWIVSSVSVFLKDFSQLVNILLQIGFWLAPIFWNPGTMSESVMRVLKLNPIYYIIVGYRSCLIDGIPFWDRGPITYYYWAVTMSIFIIGATVLRRLRAHFADIL